MDCSYPSVEKENGQPLQLSQVLYLQGKHDFVKVEFDTFIKSIYFFFILIRFSVRLNKTTPIYCLYPVFFEGAMLLSFLLRK